MKEKIGVYICHCGGNISDYVDVEQVRQLIENEDGVAITKTIQFACSDSGQKEIENDIRDKNLDAIVVASCSPKLHLHTFQNVAQRADLNKYNYVQVNIREQCSWAHSDKPLDATKKAVGLVKAGTRRVAQSESIEVMSIKIEKSTLVVGGGIAGITAAINLAKNGYKVFLIEKENMLGGSILNNNFVFPSMSKGSQIIDNLILELNKLDNIEIFTSSNLSKVSGSVGNFSIELEKENEIIKFNAGSILVATGFDNFKPNEEHYNFLKNDFIITLPEFQKIIEQNSEYLIYKNKKIKKVSFIYCVGSRESKGNNKYCSRICCTTTIYSSLALHKKFKDVKSFHFYRDIRTYGKQEIYYEEASRQGDLFFKFEEKEPPIVNIEGGNLSIKVKDYLSDRKELELETDLIVLVTGMTPREDNKTLAEVLKIPIGQDKFYNEIHPKLKPVETVIKGIFISGCSQGPKNISESVQSSLAAVSKINNLLQKGIIELPPIVAMVDANKCVYCGKCADVCEYNAISEEAFENKTIAHVNKTLCVGCGICGAFCPVDAINIAQYTNNEIMAMVDGFCQEFAVEPKQEKQIKKTTKKISINGYPKIYKEIANIITENAKSIPQISNELNIDIEEITYNIMSMNKFGIVEADGLNENEDYYLYKMKN